MRVMWAFVIVAMVALFLVALAWFAKYLSTPARSTRSERRQLAEYEEFVDRLREIAYDHRDLDSSLASIITDEIRTFQHQQRRELK